MLCSRRLWQIDVKLLCCSLFGVLAVLLVLDFVPRAYIKLGTEPETQHWESWEEDYIYKQRREGDLLPYLKERFEITQRRWNTLLFGKATVQEYLLTQCANVSKAYEPLIAGQLAPWKESKLRRDLLERWPDRIYIFKDRVYFSHGSERARLMPTFHWLLQHIRLHAKLPDMILPLNTADEPVIIKDGTDPPTPVMSFCKTDAFSDVLIPNIIEGDVFMRPAAQSAYRRRSRAGAGDPRLPRAVWRGSTGGFGGLAKGRLALLNLGQARPDLLDSGAILEGAAWDEGALGPPAGRIKPTMTIAEQVDKYKYLVWVPGNCASVRLALQLASDALVLKVDSPEREWYYSLLQPWVHYIPLTANESHVNLEDMVLWAEAHPERVQDIVAAATDFARLYLSAHGRDCYMLQLLHAFHGLSEVLTSLPPNTEYRPEWTCC